MKGKIMTDKIIEICCGSYKDCLAADQGGAKRVELNSALCIGGLTPSLATLEKVKEDTKLKVICMVRPRAAGFCYGSEEIEIMMKDAGIFLENGADGISFGFLKKNGEIDIDNTAKMTELVHQYGKEAVFHRAFDVTPGPERAMEQLIAHKVDRVLTSGQKQTAAEGIFLIRKLHKQYGGDIQIMPGSGIHAKNAPEILKETGVSQLHSSCKSYLTDLTTTAGEVSYSYLDEFHKNDYDVVDKELVEKLVNICT